MLGTMKEEFPPHHKLYAVTASSLLALIAAEGVRMEVESQSKARAIKENIQHEVRELGIAQERPQKEEISSIDSLERTKTLD